MFPPLILPSRIRSTMGRSVNFDDKFFLNAQEIYDERTNGNLTSEFEAVKPLRTNLSPENSFSHSLFSAQRARE